MSTIDHVTIRAGDRDSMVKFYDGAFDLLDFAGDRHAGDAGVEWGDFSLAEADAERAPTEGLHIAFTADSRQLVDSWWRGMIDAGYRSDGEPGPRPQYRPDYYGAFVLDSQGNSVEAVTHARAREQNTGSIDHLWIRVEELEPITRFYGLIAPVLRLKPRDLGERYGLVAEAGSFTFTKGRPTRNLHLAIGVGDQQTVDAFYASAIAAGGRDYGAPGERPQYHPGYYGAFVLDPAGTNLEAVFHNRSVTSTSAAN
jgi:catechol 2,3-dioxygenase-like lactoylglutathione lyase family enzyme